MTSAGTTTQQQALHLARKLGYDSAKEKLYQQNQEETTLTDEQCNSFRRSESSFNEMVRAIYKAGYEKATAQL